MDADARYAALVTRDRRYDGVFFVGVSTTGIYCRPICPARTPGRTRCSFHETAAQAEAAGFRACFRCRPELAPGNAEIDAVDTLVATAAARITDGALNEGSVDDLAAELGVSARHLRRAMEARLGVSPIDLAQTRRLALAKQLLQDTGLSLTAVAFAAGFQSLRRFNAVFAEVMGSAPGALRRTHADPVGETLALRLDYRAPYDFDQILTFLAARAIPGVERVDRDSYRRVVHLDGKLGTIEVRRDDRRDALVLAISPSLTSVLMRLVARVRSMFDLDARPDVIDGVLGNDPVLAKLVAKRPGLRVPGAIDGFEAAVRALLGQQVSVAAATTLAGRFADRFGTPYDGGDGLTHRFPTAKEIVEVGVDRIAKIGLPGARAAAVHGFAVAIEAKQIELEGRELEPFVTTAIALRGIGPWTAHYLAMRALHLPDAFPAADLGILKALDRVNPRDAEARAEAWRPFRSYAVMHLWTSLGDGHESNDDRVAARKPAPVRKGRRARGAVPPRAGRSRGNRTGDAGADANRASARRVLRGRPQDVRSPDRT